MTMEGPRPALATVLESLVGAYLALVPNRRELLAPVAGKTLALRLRPFGVLYFCPTEQSLPLLSELTGAPDVAVSGHFLALARLGLAGSLREALAKGDLAVEGDAEAARRFQRLFERLASDWETQLAGHAGRGFAAAVAGLLRAGLAWSSDTAAAFRANLAEFWQEETRELPARPEADAFFDAVDVLRADYDRLEARLLRLEANLAGTPSASVEP